MTRQPTAASVVRGWLEEQERSMAWLARKCQVSRQTVRGWLDDDDERFPFSRRRQVQAAIFLGHRAAELPKE